MLTKAKDIIGLKVISIAEGKEIGTVKEVVYDPTRQRVRALLLDEGGVFSDGRVVMMEDVGSIGRDAVMLRSTDVIAKVSDTPNDVGDIAKSNQYLTNTRIMTESGMDLGEVTDILFDSTTGMVEEFEVSQGFRDLQSGRKTVRVSDLITVGEDVTVVRDYTERDFESQAQERGLQGGLNRAMEAGRERREEMRERAPGIWEEAKAQFRDLGETIRDKYEDVKESPEARKFRRDVKRSTTRVGDIIEERKRDYEAQKAENEVVEENRDDLDLEEKRERPLFEQKEPVYSQTITKKRTVYSSEVTPDENATSVNDLPETSQTEPEFVVGSTKKIDEK